MVATAGLALTCLLTNQDSHPGSDSSSHNPPPTAHFGGVHLSPFKCVPRRNSIIAPDNLFVSSPLLVPEVQAKAQEEDVVGLRIMT